MADTEEPQYHTTLAERIAALNKQKNFSTSTPNPEPIRKRPPPPPPPGRPVAEARSQTLPVISTTNPSPKASPALPARPKRQPTLPAPHSTVSENVDPHQPQNSGHRAPPPLPTRTSSSQASPALPTRRPSAQSTNLKVRRGSGSSAHSTISNLSLGHGSERGNAYKLPPAYDPSSLPALPPTRREREAQEPSSQPRQSLVSAKSAPIVRQIEPPPAPKPTLPPRLPSRPVQSPPTLPSRNTEPAPAPNPLIPSSTQTKRPAVLGFGSSRQQSPQLPNGRPTLPSRPSQQSENDGPPPIPTSSRPSVAQIEAASSRVAAPAPVVDDCFTCRDWSGPDNVAAQFPRQSLPRKDPVGHLARGLCDPFPSYTDKARAIFTWFHHNIYYDTVSFFGNCVKHVSVEDTIFSGKAVCQGYAETYKAIANRAGLECVLVGGHGKGYGYAPLKKGERPPPPKPDGHAWNAVRIDGGDWKLLDACWGAGHLDTGAGEYKQKFNPSEFTKSNDKFGLSHFPRESKYQFRADGRVMSWDEYFIGRVNGETPIFYTNGHQEGVAEDSVEPMERDIPVYSGEVVRFQFSKICEHWTSEKHGLGKPPLLLLSIHGADGRKDEMVPIETNGYWHWIDVDARDLGAPGQSVQVAQLTSIDGKDARGVSAKEYFAKRGKVGMAWAYVMRWELV